MRKLGGFIAWLMALALSMGIVCVAYAQLMKEELSQVPTPAPPAATDPADPIVDLLGLLGLGKDPAPQPTDPTPAPTDPTTSTGDPTSTRAEAVAHGLWYEQLSASQQPVYDELYEGLQDGSASVTVTGTTHKEVEKAYLAVYGDHPELFWLANAYHYEETPSTGEVVLTPTFVIAADEIAKTQADIDDVVAGICAQLPEAASDYDKVRLCYDWIIDHVDYRHGDNDQDITSVFLEGESVCAGYSRSNQYLLHLMDVRCDYLAGADHAWNLVWIDGTPTYVDVTWGDPTFEENTDPDFDNKTYDYLCLTADELYRNHAVEEPVSDVAQLPACDSTTYDYYRLNGSYADGFSAEFVGRLIAEADAAGQREIRFKLGSAEAYQQAMDFLADGNNYAGFDAVSNVSSVLYSGNELLYTASLSW